MFSNYRRLSSKIEHITDEFLLNYYPRVMGVSAISGFSRTPQITMPIAETRGGVPIGLSFMATYLRTRYDADKFL